MRIQGGLDSCVGRLTRGAIAIGNFDGVHLGHLGLFDAALSASRQDPGPSAALTFEPHPAKLLAPDYAPPRITTLDRKRELCAAAGLDVLVEQPFDRAFASLAPGDFVERVAKTGASQVVVGPDFTYGRDRKGTVETLRSELSERGIRLHVVLPITVHGLVVSSTKVREFALEGRVQAAAALLGRPLDLDGEVVRGEGRGRKLGFPTANIRTAAELLPKVGVYAVRARVQESGATPHGPVDAGGGFAFHPPRSGPALPAAANLGLNPTFRADAHAGAGREQVVLEVHLLDTDRDLYGAILRVEFHHRLRDERRFPSVEVLQKQIANDVAEARRLLAP
ncbi:MAG: bifunctional riboflavin kinase/FMN adenylyltransferase [Myxococcales bacterium]